MGPELLALSLASAIVLPRGGSFSRDSSDPRYPETAPPPAAGPSQESRTGDTPQRLESSQEREERLMREGIRKRPEPKTETPRDYFSVLKAQITTQVEGSILNPQLWFGLGFASWFPLRESGGRKSTPGGSYQGYAQLWNSGAKTIDGQPCKTARFCTYQSLHFAFLATQAETMVTGTEPVRGESIDMNVLHSDIEWGLLWRYDWHWGAPDSNASYAAAFMGGVLPFRQRLMETYGSAVAKEQDLAHSGAQLNPLGTLTRFSASVIALSIFEAGIVTGLSTSSPAEVKAYVGLEFALRDPQRPQDAPLSKENSPAKSELPPTQQRTP